MRAEIVKGDVIRVNNMSFRVDKVIHCDYFYPEGYEIDYIDVYGIRRHWRQWLEGGVIIKNSTKAVVNHNMKALCYKYGY